MAPNIHKNAIINKWVLANLFWSSNEEVLNYKDNTKIKKQVMMKNESFLYSKVMQKQRKKNK